MKKLLKKLQLEFNKFVKAIRKKIADKKAIRARLKREKRLAIEKFNYEKNLRDSFEKSFNVKSDEIRSIMGINPVAITDQKDLTNKLIEGKLHTNTIASMNLKYKERIPFFYNPEICDIHNENPDREGYISITDLLAEETENDQKRLNPEKANFKAKIQRKADFVWKTRK